MRIPLLALMLWSVSAAALADLPALPGAAESVVLRYEAFVAGARIGDATVEVRLADDEYRVHGSARSNGWLSGFSHWRNRFTARGRLDGSGRQAEEFSYVERDTDSSREVTVRDGTLQVVKNGRKRPERPSPAAQDLVSALFVQPHCGAGHTLHTGRHVYRLDRIRQGPASCRYRVADDDGDTFEVELLLARRERLVVPRRITVHGWLTGWVELVDGPETVREVRPGD